MFIQQTQSRIQLNSRVQNESRRSLVRTLVDTMNGHRADDVARLLTEDYEGRNVPLGTNVNGRAEVRDGLVKLFRAFPDLSIRVHGMLEGSDSLVLYWSATGTHRGDFERIPATGRETTASGSSLFHFDGAAIADGLHVWDFAGLLRSMRLLPSLPGRAGDRQHVALDRHFGCQNG